ALKTFGTMGFMLLFFAGYFGVMRHPLAPPTVMPLTIIDEWIPFTPAAFGAYVSLWVYVSLAPAFLPDRRQLLGYGLWIGTLCLFCLVVFWLWPTTIPQDSVDWAAHPGRPDLRSPVAASFSPQMTGPQAGQTHMSLMQQCVCFASASNTAFRR
ncbi:MAG: hypothetical protein WBB96_01790, partial [Candidatus Dechloromonas phosphoritropha]